MSQNTKIDEVLSRLRAQDGACAVLETTTSGSSSLGWRRGRALLAENPRAILVTDGKNPPFDRLRAFVHGLPPDGAVVGALAYDARRLVALAVDRLVPIETALPAPLPQAATPRVDLARHSNFTREEYRERVRRIQEHIAAGDIYQANLSQRFELPWARTGLDLYAALRRVSPAPFSGYLRAGGLEIVSASPERLLLVEDGRASTRPIAGTRPRAKDAAADRALARELLLSEKERAEPLMLVDLERNDLGRVAEVGSVHVDELMGVEDYAHVRHIVSNVTARLAPGRDAVDALHALFPGGTITGVPKRRCMQILDEIEPQRRGFYTGSLFYLTPAGEMDANILIRGAVVSAGTVAFHTGAGIVADSDPDFEYEETLHKAEGMRLALEAALAGSC
jgi:anthranilate/para-aminobenzoate synthase component I